MIRTRLVAQRLAFLFLLGCVFFNYPLLSIFNQGGSLFGMPPLYAWLMGSWLVLIALLALVIEAEARLMLQVWVIVLASFLYLGVLFGIAWYADHRADHGRSLIANPVVYALSLGVYCTTWTFYGSVGRAAANGIGFLPIYLGPTLLFALAGFILYRMIRVAKANRITSIADFVASRYGKSQLLGGLVTVIAVVGVIPYIALQLKAVSNSFTILSSYPEIVMPASAGAVPLFQDSALYVAMILAAFTILFGTRHLDATERHEGMVAAIAVESIVKLVAFLAVGAFVVWGLHGGVADIFARAAEVPEVARRLTRADTVGRLRQLGHADLPLAVRVAAAAAPVPDRGGGKRRRQAPQPRGVDVPALPVPDQPVRAAGGAGRTAALPGRHRRCRHLRADPADGPPAGGPGAVRLHRRPLGGHRHGHRRNHRAVHHGLQRPGDAAAAAHALAGPGREGRPLRPAAGDPALGHRHHPRPGLPLLPRRRRGLRAGLDRPDLLRRRGPVRAGGDRRPVLEGRHARRRGGGSGRRLRALGLHLLLPSFAKSGWLPEGFIAHGLFGIELLRPQHLFG
jgi:hypothetical protein